MDFFFNDLFLAFLPFLFDRTVVRQETKLEREEGWDRERSASRDSNTGRSKHNGATCRRAAHEAISTNILVDFDVATEDRHFFCHWKKQYYE